MVGKKKEKKTGRRSIFESHVYPRILEIKQWNREGYGRQQVAQLLNIGYSTLRKFITYAEECQERAKQGELVSKKDAQYVAFVEAVQCSQLHFNSLVEAAIFKSAIGFTTRSTKFVRSEDGKSWIEYEQTHQEQGPNSKMALYYTANLNKNFSSEAQLNRSATKRELSVIERAYKEREKSNLSAIECGRLIESQGVQITKSLELEIKAQLSKQEQEESSLDEMDSLISRITAAENQDEDKNDVG